MLNCYVKTDSENKYLFSSHKCWLYNDLLNCLSWLHMRYEVLVIFVYSFPRELQSLWNLNT